MKKPKKTTPRILLIRGLALFLIVTTFNSCTFFESSVEIQFNHFWDDQRLSSGNLTFTEFTAESGEVIVIDHMTYVISEIQLKRESRGDIYVLSDIEVGKQLNSWFATASDIPNDRYEITFVFGLEPSNNVENPNYDLPDSFLVPQELGGGYHFMHIDGRYKDQNGEFQPYAFHTSNAVDASNPNNIQIEDTSFKVSLGTHYLSGGPFYSFIDVEVNIAEWFRDPNTWNFSELNSGLIMNYEAQIQMKENGQKVFSLFDITQD